MVLHEVIGLVVVDTPVDIGAVSLLENHVMRHDAFVGSDDEQGIVAYFEPESFGKGGCLLRQAYARAYAQI